MLRCLACLLMVGWCLIGAAALPIQRAEWNPTRILPSAKASRRLSIANRRAPRHPAPVAEIDQSAEASALVPDFVPHRINQFSDGKFSFSRPDLKSRYDLQSTEQQPSPYRRQPPFSDCYNCRPQRQNIVALGESRSYSVVTNPRKFEEPEESTTLRLSTTLSDETTTVLPLETTTVLDDTVISIRVSSSVGKSVQQLPEPASLLTEERPLATAVQRSHFSVEEADHDKSESFGERFRSNPFVTSASMSTEASISSSSHPTTLGKYPTPLNSRTDRSLYLEHTKLIAGKANKFNYQETVEDQTPSADTRTGTQSVVVVDTVDNPLRSPVSYHTSLRSATSGSRVSFYRDPPHYRAGIRSTSTTEASSTTSKAEPQTERLKHETRVETVSFREEVVHRPKEKIENHAVNKDKSYQFTNVNDKSFHHVQVTHLESNDNKRTAAYTTERKYPQAEKVYGMPEQNYEVDEALSLQTNGRAHGVQGTPTTKPDNNKFGYVVEGRDFKKYRVEERTSDGFIVGEYGVVRHDDGSLRGVRYTADSTINPKVIYEALVKFLSL